jgi:hypothetical protein
MPQTNRSQKTLIAWEPIGIRLTPFNYFSALYYEYLTSLKCVLISCQIQSVVVFVISHTYCDTFTGLNYKLDTFITLTPSVPETFHPLTMSTCFILQVVSNKRWIIGENSSCVSTLRTNNPVICYAYVTTLVLYLGDFYQKTGIDSPAWIQPR